MPKYLDKITWHEPKEIPNSLATSLVVSIWSVLTKSHTFVVTSSLCSVKDVHSICCLLQKCTHFWSCGTTQSLCMAHGLPLKGSIKYSVSFDSCFLMLCTKFDTHFILSDIRCAVRDTVTSVYLQWLYQTEWLQSDIADRGHVEMCWDMLRKVLILFSTLYHSVTLGYRKMNSVWIVFDQASYTLSYLFSYPPSPTCLLLESLLIEHKASKHSCTNRGFVH
jgi:hypothetical protein